MIAIFASCKTETKSNTDIIPKPQFIEPLSGQFEISSSTTIYAKSSEAIEAAHYLHHFLRDHTDLDLSIVNKKRSKDQIQIETTKSHRAAECYQLYVNDNLIQISAPYYAGLFYGVQSLRALLPAEIESFDQSSNQWVISGVKIDDAPRFQWRGMMLDCSRHFFPVSYIKKHLDRMSRLKMNVFHWHLIDDQGWRIEIKKYPKLTETSSWRADYESLPWGDRPTKDREDGRRYGGFYTQEQIQHIVRYAQERNITVVPEIEMPAHVTALFAAYPEFSCKGKRLNVPTGSLWPITDIYCAGKEETFQFIEDVLSEVMDLFPSKYIHIGGDEANKKEWEHCPDCQRRIKQEGLENVEALQSYFITRVEKFLNKYDRELIGWDEILEGGLAPNAAVMSWRGMQGGIKAAKMHHPVVMTPTQHCYFDYYQGARDLEPLAFGANLPIEKVYEFNPVPKELNATEANYILGVQANLWTEHVATTSHAEYMTFPRLAAMSEVAWTNQENRNWKDFQKRMHKEYLRYQKAGIHYAKSAFNVNFKTEYNEEKKVNTIILQSSSLTGDIYYTLDGTEPNMQSNRYSSPITVDKTTTVKAIQIKDGQPVSKTTETTVYVHIASDGVLTHNTIPSSKYPDKKRSLLNNCTMGTQTFTDGQWVGYEGTDMDVTINLGKVETISSLQSRHLYNPGSWIFLPASVSYEYSMDNKKYQSAGVVRNEFTKEKTPIYYDYPLILKSPIKARYIHITAKNIGACPDWHSGKGQPSWLFCDEIIVK
ncbi:family 20 glycosylhydrolase [Halosquirtibacter xylanolyticus]|uniref:glycoside hydrolase family 20 protein n=1 Tax=Halosquirtibacter xylanolyticus TaxID=3374599 RepID=UPI0037485650|nr:family 20 glycosylhydrolase [Prolixibacteraceae bacterium]